MKSPLRILVLLTAILISHAAALEMEHGIVFHKEGRFAGWPANGGIWNWGNEILIMHSDLTYHYYPNQHSYDRSKPVYTVLSRSLDAGETWETIRSEAFTEKDPRVLDEPMDFANPDFGLRSRDNLFWHTDDRGHHWKGPFLFPDFGIENPLTSRTDYLIDDENTLLVFLSAKAPSVQAGLQDRAFSARTNDGGLSWQFQGWMTAYPYGVRSVMPSTVPSCGTTNCFQSFGGGIDAHDNEELGRLDVNWVEAEYSEDNGRNWIKQSMVAFTDISHHNGNPGALAILGDGTLVVVYGFRGSPFGIRAKTSTNGGKTWGHEIILRDDGLVYDLGYPKAVTLPDGRVFVCYYIATPERPNQHIAYTILKTLRAAPSGFDRQPLDSDSGRDEMVSRPWVVALLMLLPMKPPVSTLSRAGTICRLPASVIFLLAWLLVPGPTNAEDQASAEPTATAGEAAQEPESQPAPSAGPAPQKELLTLERIDQELSHYPAPGPDKPASHEHKVLTEAQSELRAEERWIVELAHLQATVDGADAQLAEFGIALEATKDPVYPPLPDELKAIEQQLSQRKSELADARARLEALGSELSGLPEKRLVEVDRTNQLEALLRSLNAESATSEVDKLLLGARRQNAEAELALTKLSVSSSDSLRSLIMSEEELRRAEVNNLEARVATLTEQTAEQRRIELQAQEKEARQALRAATLQDPELQELAEEHQVWLEERRGIETERAAMEERIGLYEKEATDIRNTLESIKRRLGIAGNSPAIGTLIQRAKLRMPDLRDVKRTRSKINRSLRQCQIRILELELERGELVDLTDKSAPGGEDSKSAVYREVYEELFAQRLRILDDLTSDSNRYFDVLVSLDTAIQSVGVSIQSFEKFAVANSLWIPDKTVLNRQDLLQIPSMMAEVSGQTPKLFEDSVYKSEHRSWISLILIAALAAAVRLLRARVTALQSVSLRETQFLNVVGPFLYESLVAVLPMTILFGTAWVLDAPDIENAIAHPIRDAASGLAVAMAFGVLLTRLCGAKGIGRLQFGWPAAICSRIRRTFLHYVFPAYAVFFVSSVLERYGLFTGQRTGSRFVTLVGVVLIILALHRVFDPRHGILSHQRIRSFLRKPFIRRIVHLGLIAWPGYLGVLIAIGYSVAVRAFFVRTIQTLWLVAAIAIISGVIGRLSRAQRLRALLEWQGIRRKNPDFVHSGVGSAWREIRDQSRDFARIVSTFGFIVGLGWIWADTVPALRHLGANPLIGSGDHVLLTLSQGIRLLVCIVATTVLAIHLPRILQILVFSQFKRITQGNRYALSTLLSYLVVVIGIIWGSVIAGIRWESIQWLLAAVTVGLGFGLQEIFGNLFAGIILLFERPIRVGDVVSIGNTTGAVTRIRIRSTTIRQWDKRELIVPNKDIITGQVVNWTLSDATTRISLEVAVSHDSDTGKVSRILREILRSQYNVLKNPAPVVFLKEIDDFSIRYNCFAYLNKLSDRLTTTSRLYEKILDRFQDEGITIPYPKRDIRVQEADPSEAPPAN